MLKLGMQSYCIYSMLGAVLLQFPKEHNIVMFGMRNATRKSRVQMVDIGLKLVNIIEALQKQGVLRVPM